MSLIAKLKGILFPSPTEPNAPPSWISRLQDSKYISIGGVTSDFLYLDLKVIFGNKTSIFESAIGNGAYVQLNGVKAVRFPSLLMFSGDEHDKKANACVQSLLEQGEGTLYHPIFGPANVVPVGNIEYVSNLVSEANQTTILVELVETTGLLIDNLTPFESILDNFNEISADSFAEKLNVDDVADEVNAKSKISSKVGQIKTALSNVTAGVGNAQAALDDTADSINRGLDTLIKDPLVLASQMQTLITSPSRIAQDLRSKLDAYKNLARIIFLGPDVSTNGYDFQGQNSFHVDKLVASSCVVAAAISTQEAELTTKQEYIDAAVLLVDLIKELIDWSDNSYEIIDGETVSSSDTGDGFQDLVDFVAGSAGDLIKRSFNAQTEIKTTLEVERAAYDLCFELYQDVSHDALWFFYNTNNLSGDEIFIIPAGREIVKYV